MSKRKLSFCVAVAVLAVVAAVLALLPSKSRPGVTQEHFKLLRPGMTQAEVQRLLHGPPRNDLRHTAIIWVPQATGKRISAWIEPASPAVELLVREDVPKGGRQGLTVTPTLDFFPQVTSKDGRQAVWVTRTGLIAVYFGPDGRLRNKYISMVDEMTPPSLAGWLASRPRMIRRSLGL
jgi:hypothetical protein